MDPEKFPALIWSLSRKVRREFCGRGAVMHYREAPLGAAEGADELHRRIWQAHRKIGDDKFLRQLLLHTMRRQFVSGESSKSMLLPELLENFDREFERIWLGNSANHLASLRDCTIGAKRRELFVKLQDLCTRLTDGAWQKLLDIAPEKRRRMPEVLDLQFNNLRCFASPLASFSEKGRLQIVELRGGEFAAFESEVQVIHQFYAMNFCGRSPDMVDSWVLDYHTGQLRQFGTANDCSEGMNRIIDEVSKWQEILPLDLADIPPGNRENCARCGFAEICEYLEKQ